jgi:hypothetical protein
VPCAGKPRRLAGCWAAAPPSCCVNGAYVQRGGVHAGGVAIVPAVRLRDAPATALPDGDVELLAVTARMRLRPAA